MERCFGYTIFKDPKDAPGHYVVRGWDIEAGRTIHSAEAIATPISDKALAALRQSLVEMGLTCVNRQLDDDPCIVESWV